MFSKDTWNWVFGFMYVGMAVCALALLGAAVGIVYLLIKGVVAVLV